ncbi:MAG TPA: LysM peptidoglycan-binding domain-containing protein [Pirellulales bacterium]|nr:LysM peptidoglycan-binding domain-containing protein [Pirellulales bacterium]
MAKETKIGVVVVGLLTLVFGGLLLRRMLPPGAAANGPGESQVANVEPSRAPVEDPRSVAVEQPAIERESAEHETRTPERDRRDRPESAEVPRGEFTPTGGPDEPGGRYAPEGRTARVPSASSDPFDRPNESPQALPDHSLREPKKLEPTNDVSALEPSAARNPLRRLSAEEPVGQDPTPAEAIATVPAEPDLNAPDAAAAADDPPAGDAQPSTPEEVETAVRGVAAEAQSPVVPVAEQPRFRNRYQPGVQPAAATEPRPLEEGKYTVQPNDSLWIISEKVYGTGRYFKAIYEHNRAKLPNSHRLQVGIVISVPATSVLEQNYPALCPKQRRSAVVQPRTLQASTRQGAGGGNGYVVEEGDTLFDIARWELGKASRWAEIYELNRDALGEDFDYLQPGTELKMPPKAQSGDAVTRQRDSRLQR